MTDCISLNKSVVVYYRISYFKCLIDIACQISYFRLAFGHEKLCTLIHVWSYSIVPRDVLISNFIICRTFKNKIVFIL